MVTVVDILMAIDNVTIDVLVPIDGTVPVGVVAMVHDVGVVLNV
jgi:hypothetical protein